MLRNRVTIWVVRVGDDVYVRSWKGHTSGWFRAAQVRHAGHVKAGGVGKDVRFVAETDDNISDEIGHGSSMMIPNSISQPNNLHGRRP